MTSGLTKKILQLRGTICHYCKRQTHRKDPRHKLYATVDHLIPKSRGGTIRDDNLVIACLECNGKKKNMTEPEYRNATQEKGDV